MAVWLVAAMGLLWTTVSASFSLDSCLWTRKVPSGCAEIHEHDHTITQACMHGRRTYLVSQQHHGRLGVELGLVPGLLELERHLQLAHLQMSRHGGCAMHAADCCGADGAETREELLIRQLHFCEANHTMQHGCTFLLVGDEMPVGVLVLCVQPVCAM